VGDRLKVISPSPGKLNMYLMWPEKRWSQLTDRCSYSMKIYFSSQWESRYLQHGYLQHRRSWPQSPSCHQYFFENFRHRSNIWRHHRHGRSDGEVKLLRYIIRSRVKTSSSVKILLIFPQYHFVFYFTVSCNLSLNFAAVFGFAELYTIKNRLSNISQV